MSSLQVKAEYEAAREEEAARQEAADRKWMLLQQIASQKAPKYALPCTPHLR
jgi:hypothetical protein